MQMARQEPTRIGPRVFCAFQLCGLCGGRVEPAKQNNHFRFVSKLGRPMPIDGFRCALPWKPIKIWFPTNQTPKTHIQDVGPNGFHFWTWAIQGHTPRLDEPVDFDLIGLDEPEVRGAVRIGWADVWKHSHKGTPHLWWGYLTRSHGDMVRYLKRNVRD